MKKLILSVLIVLMASGAFGATLNLKASWTPNTETDMKEYRLYRTDGVRTLLGTIPHPTATYDFSLTVVDVSTGTAKFVLTAVDHAGNQSLDSTEVLYVWDLVPPARPVNVIIQFR